MRTRALVNICACFLCVITVMARSTPGQSEVPKQVPENLSLLTSKDMNERRQAIDTLYHLFTQNEEGVNETLIEKSVNETLIIERLLTYVQRWDENSYKAALLLGRIGDKKAIPILKMMLTNSEQIKGITNERYVLAPRMRLACLKALLLLHDEEASEEVRALLKSDSIEDRSNGIECIAYANRKDMIPELVPLLNDKRDAVNIAPSGGTYYLRICDLAANAIADTIHISISFDMQYGERYSDQQLSEIHDVVSQLGNANSN